MIYHITSAEDWEKHKHELDFVPADYLREGFIHCCTLTQLKGVKERYFKGKSGLVLLYLAESKLKAALKYEISTSDEKFPHLYGPINRDAVIKVERLT